MTTIEIDGKEYANGVYYLKPIYTSQKSFYQKAVIDVFFNIQNLYSYSTRVCYISNGKFKRLWSGYSKTTLIHINDFRMQNGLPALSKKDWLSLPIER